VDAFHGRVRRVDQVVGGVVLDYRGGQDAGGAGGGYDVGFLQEVGLESEAAHAEEEVLAEDESSVGHPAGDFSHLGGVDAVAPGHGGYAGQDVELFSQSTAPSSA